MIKQADFCVSNYVFPLLNIMCFYIKEKSQEVPRVVVAGAPILCARKGVEAGHRERS